MTVGTNLREFVEAVVTASGGGGGAPTGASYVTLGTDATLTAERVLTAGSGITLTDAGAGSTVTVAVTAGTFQPLDADLTTLAATSSTDGHVWRRAGGTWAYGTLGHTALTSLAWTASGHTGTNATLAGWSGGVPVEVATSTFAAASHTHAAGDITSGTLATARLGTGTATGAVLVGGAWVAGSTAGEVLRWSGSAWAASALSAADISTGAVSVAARLGWLSTTATASTTDATNGTTTNTPSWSVTTGKTYMVEMVGTFDCAAGTSGFRVRLEESGGASSSACAGQVWYAHASGIAAEPLTAAGTWTAAGTGSTSRAGIEMRTTYVCTGTGTLKLAIRPETPASNVNLYAKTIYRLLEI
mgnify:CR=1 FL=1